MTKLREVQGMIVTPVGIRFGTVTLRVTKDDIGQSMSLADDKSGFMLQIPIEPVADLIEVKGR